MWIRFGGIGRLYTKKKESVFQTERIAWRMTERQAGAGHIMERWFLLFTKEV